MADPAQRQTKFAPGANFSKGPDGEEMFSFVNDGSSIVGPRPATDDDRKKFAAEYKAFQDGPPEDNSVDTFKAEIASLKTELENRTTDLEGMVKERDGARAEVESLTKERDELVRRAAAPPQDPAATANAKATKKHG